MNKPSIDLRGMRIAIVTHRSLLPCIPGGDLKRFVLEKGCSHLEYVTHPLLYLKESYQLSSQREYYHQGKLKKISYAYHWLLPEPLLYIKDLVYSFYWLSTTKGTYDIHFGINNLNALVGLVLKKLGRTKKVIYYTIDLFPQRFSNKLINWIYHKLDNFCVRYCDETWNLSPNLTKYREKKGVIGLYHSHQFTVPMGIWFDKMKRVTSEKTIMTKIVYVGHLTPFMGVDLAIQALSLIRRKVPGAHLNIIGGGEQQEDLEQLTRKLKVSDSVKFFGWKEKKEVVKLIADAAVGLAPFNTLIIDEKVKNADPAKIKDYLALGLPIVMTNASPNASAIANARCGIVIENYNSELLAKAVIKLLKSKKLREEYRRNALIYAQQFDWNKLFTTNLSRLLHNYPPTKS